jgi:LmbE family N-acetylglucosaminyl deacetylase
MCRPKLFRSALAFSVSASLFSSSLATCAQAPIASPGPSAFAEPLRVDRGSAALWQSLKKLNTRASLLMVVAHPDDEDGGMLSYESRGQGVDTTLLTLNRGEGGQNIMSSDYWDQLGEVRTQELLAAGRYYGVHQYFTRVADFGFSKTMEEAFKQWGHDRVLYDCVRVVRMTRPLVVTSVFVGNVSDGHGHHQVAGDMAQEVYKAAADPNMFPDQIKEGLKPWAPLKVYARVPFARVTDKGIYDYATGHWAPVRFRNYVTGEWIEGIPSTTVEVPEGTDQPLFGDSYLAVAREGLSMQKSQNGGVGAPPPGPSPSPYHLYASRVPSEMSALPQHESDFFQGVDISLAGIADYAPASEQAAWKGRLQALSATVQEATAAFDATNLAKSAPALAKGLSQTRELLQSVAASKLPADAIYNMTYELKIKEAQFDEALGQALGATMLATLSNGTGDERSGPLGSRAIQEPTFQTTIAGETLYINTHIADEGTEPLQNVHARIVSTAATDWTIEPVKQNSDTMASVAAGQAVDVLVKTTTPADAALTKPYFTRPNVEQPYYDLSVPQDLSLPTTPYPLTAEVTYTYAGVQAHLEGVVQSIRKLVGLGPVPEPLLVAPPISVTVSPYAGVVPLSSRSFDLSVTVHNSVKGPAQGHVKLELPAGWTSQPANPEFSIASNGEDSILNFHVIPSSVETKPYTISAVAEYNGQQFREGFQETGYPGLRPYPYYRNSTYKTTGVDVKVAPALKVGYIMGTGDDVAKSLMDVGVHPTFLSAQDVATGDLSQFDAIVLGIRAYAARPELLTYNNRLLEYVKQGGAVVVQYQTGEYDHNFGPYPLTLSADPEKVVEEDAKVTLLKPDDPLLTWPNKITMADFDGWVEERGHGFMRSWAPQYTALTEVHDVDQDPQKGGLLYAHYGKGAYVYLAYELFRQMPEGVPGAFRLMANLISAGKNPGFKAQAGTQ